MNVLVTGNKGYIGSILTKILIDKGHLVKGLDTDYYKYCNFYSSNLSFKQIIKDVRNINEEDLDNIDAIIHLAALSNDPLSNFNEKITYDINHKASVRLAKIAKSKKIKRFIFASSQSVYGKVDGSTIVTEKTTPRPLTAYGKSKLLAEKDILFMTDSEFSPVSLRPSTVYGISPKLRLDIVLNNLVGWATTTKVIRLSSNGTPWRPVINIEDISNAFIAAMVAPDKIVKGEIFNVGEKQSLRIKDMAEMVKKNIKGSKVLYPNVSSKDERSYNVDSTKFLNQLKNFYQQKWQIEKGIVDLYKNYKKYNLTQDLFLSNKFIRIDRLKKLVSEDKLDNNFYWK